MNGLGSAALLLAASITAGAQDWSGFQARPTPFRPCVASQSPAVSLTLAEEQPRLGAGVQGPVVRVSLRNLTDRQLTFVDKTPEGLFSMTVLEPHGDHAGIQ